MKKIEVYFQDGKTPIHMGALIIQVVRNREVSSFSYDEVWLKNTQLPPLDPDLQLYSGPQYTDKPTFGIIADSSPDRWGRKLMLRRAAEIAKTKGEKPPLLQESDFLLGVYDLTRMGALRFKTDDCDTFQNDDTALAAPPWTQLRELEEAVRHMDDEKHTPHNRWLELLVAPGSSLGGAHPKASVTDPSGALWIAKFPSKNEAANIPAWEYVLMQMARKAGINTPETKLQKLSKFGSTLLSKRFDRDGNTRIHFASAMTLLGKSESTISRDGESYLGLAERITQISASPDEDLRELWTRIVFSVAVSNTDDHLRNHGFLMTPQGWRLSPIYDINPNSGGSGLTLNISENDNSLDFGLAQSVAPCFRIKQKEAGEIIQKVRETVRDWRSYATAANISRTRQEEMSPAFRLV